MPKHSESNTGYPGVYKIDYPDLMQIGYLAKAKRKGKNLHEVFYVHKYNGDEERCFNAAKKCAKQFFLENPRYTRQQIAQIISKRNTSGIPGVRIKPQIYKWRSDKRKESIYYFVEAAWSPAPYKRKKRVFSIDVYGEKEAWKMAVDARKKGLEDMID